MSRAPMLKKLPPGDDFYRKLGEGMVGQLRCDRCGVVHQLDAIEAGRHVHHGWPECCGETMRLVTRERL